VEDLKYEKLCWRVREKIVKMTAAAGSGHPGGSLSGVEICVLLFSEFLNLSPENAKDPGRDRFILSKGHATPLLYAVLSEFGFIPEEELESFRKLGSPLQGHPALQYGVPGVETSTGSLGQGLSVGVGMALASKLSGKGYNVFVLMGDGELDEGQVWEAAMSAAHYRLSNLIGIVDRNMLQIDGNTEEVMALGEVQEKFTAFGWKTSVCDGHSIPQLREHFRKAVEWQSGPYLIVAKTVKGKGVPFMENRVEWHGKAPDQKLAEEALSFIRRKLAELEGKP
jgi:transketolase